MRLCGQFDLGGVCPACGGDLSTIIPGGFRGPGDWFYCSEDCIGAMIEALIQSKIADHLNTRDLLCMCSTCHDAGLPTPEMWQEYINYVFGKKGGEQ